MSEETKQETEQSIVYKADIDAAVKFDRHTQISGAYEVKIIQAAVGKTQSGSIWTDLRIEIPSRLDNSGNPKQYRLQRMYLTTRKAKGNTRTFQGNILDGIMFLLDASDTIEKKVGLVFEDGTLIEKPIQQFTRILNKPIGAVLEMKYIWRRKPINGYTKIELDPVGLEPNPEIVWINNYDRDPIVTFEVICWFASKGKWKGYSCSEIKDELKTPKNVSRAIKRLRTYEFDVDGKPIMSKMSNQDMYLYIEKTLKKQLAAAGDTYDSNKFEPYEDASVEPLEKIPF